MPRERLFFAGDDHISILSFGRMELTMYSTCESYYYVYRFYLVRVESIPVIVKIARKYRLSEHMEFDVPGESVYVKQA